MNTPCGAEHARILNKYKNQKYRYYVIMFDVILLSLKHENIKQYQTFCLEIVGVSLFL